MFLGLLPLDETDGQKQRMWLKTWGLRGLQSFREEWTAKTWMMRFSER